jgi:hypothetical protein
MPRTPATTPAGRRLPPLTALHRRGAPRSADAGLPPVLPCVTRRLSCVLCSSAAAVSVAALDLVSCDTQGIGKNACIVGGQEDLNSFSRRSSPKRDVAAGLISQHARGLDVPDAVQATRDVLSPEGQVHAYRFGAIGPSSYSRARTPLHLRHACGT